MVPSGRAIEFVAGTKPIRIEGADRRCRRSPRREWWSPAAQVVLRAPGRADRAARAADVVQQKPPQPVETKVDQQTTQAPAKEPTKSEDNQRSAVPNAADPRKEPESSLDQQRNKGNEAEGVGKTDEPDKAKEPAKTNAA